MVLFPLILIGCMSVAFKGSLICVHLFHHWESNRVLQTNATPVSHQSISQVAIGNKWLIVLVAHDDSGGNLA